MDDTVLVAHVRLTESYPDGNHASKTTTKLFSPGQPIAALMEFVGKFEQMGTTAYVSCSSCVVGTAPLPPTEEVTDANMQP